MDELLKDFLKKFFGEHRIRIIWFSFWRMVAFVQVLFWPFAFSKIVDVLSQEPEHWQKAISWVAALIINKILEDFIRLRAKYGLQKIGAKLELELASFFTQETELCDGVRTGEAVQRTKKATNTIRNAARYYKDTLLQLPVNLIVIPLVLLQARPIYLTILVIYTVLYLLADYFANTIYLKEAKDFFEASEYFWGTTYRKAPDVWRKREDGHKFKETMNKEAEDLYKERMEMENVNNWRWIMDQGLSSLSKGAVIIYAVHLIMSGQAPVGDLVLVSSYFGKAQGTLNIITSTVRQVVDLRISLDRLAQAVKLKSGNLLGGKRSTGASES